MKRLVDFPLTHCGRGHKLIPENVYTRPDGKRRQCRLCKLEANRAWRRGEYMNVPFTHCRRGHILTPKNSYRLSSGGRTCALCAKERLKIQYYENGWRFSRHGITEQDYLALLEQQGGCCPICSHPLKAKEGVIDHNYQTGQVRGILCVNCNTGLGKLGDSVDSLMRVLEYVKHGNNGNNS